jgi:hypothetical protein
VKRLVIAAFLVVACGGSEGGATASPGLVGPSAVPAAQRPAATKMVGSQAPDVVFDLGVKLTKRTTSVARNTNASVTVETTKGAECGIDVPYASGSSSAKGLEPKIANSKGAVTWKWLVGRNESKGLVPIVVTCTLGERLGRLDTRFRVK